MLRKKCLMRNSQQTFAKKSDACQTFSMRPCGKKVGKRKNSGNPHFFVYFKPQQTTPRALGGYMKILVHNFFSFCFL